MAKPKLTDDQKLHIAECYQGGTWKQEDLAKLYNVSRKTIYRALLELDVLGTPHVPAEQPYLLDPASARIVEVVKAHGLDAETLYQTLNAPALTRENIILTLANLSLGDIHALLQDVIATKSAAFKQSKETPDDQVDRSAGV